MGHITERYIFATVRILGGILNFDLLKIKAQDQCKGFFNK